MAGEETVGSIVGYLRLDTTDWMTHIAAAQAAAEELGSVDPDVHVSVNSAGAISELAAIRVATERTADSMDDLGNRSQSAGQRGSHGMAGLLKALIPLSPALVPIGGAAIAAGAAFGGMGAAGVLAFLGIKDAMAQGTAEGQKFQSGLDSMQTGLHVLEGVASRNVLQGFEAGVESVNQHMPFLATEIDHLSTYLSGTLAASVDGILNLMVRLSPVFDMVGAAVERVAVKFDDWSKSAGASDFVTYLLQVLPEVGHLLANLATMVSHVVQAFAPLGSTVLSGLNGIVGLLNSIPTGTLTILASGALAVYTAFKLWTGLRSIIARVGTAIGEASVSMTGLGVAAGTARSATSALSLGLGGALAVLAAGTVAWSIWKQKQQEAEQQQRELTDAIQQDNGAIGSNTQQLLAQQLVQDGTIAKAKQMGVSQRDLTAYLKGQPGAWDAINASLVKNASVTVRSGRADNELNRGQKQLSVGAKDFEGKLKSLRGQLVKGQADVKAQKLAYQLLAGQTNSTATGLDSVTAASMRVTEANKEQKKSIDDLNKAIDAELGKQLALSGSITAYDSARNQLIKTLKKSTSTTNGNTDAGIKNRQAIENTVSALQRHRQVAIQNGASTDEATAKYQKQAAQLLTQVKRTDGASSSTYKYTKRLLDVPDDVKTKIDLPGYETAMSQARKYHIRLDDLPPSVRTLIIAETHGAEAALRRTLSLIAGLHNKTIQIDTHYTYSGTPPHGGPGTHIHPGAWANGGVVGHAYANGGVAVKSYASGGMENHIAQIATSGPRLWAEPETGGEAYIPLSPAKRPRSMRILDDVAGRFGQQLVPVAGGGSRVGLGSTAVTVMIPDSQMERFAEVVGLSVGQAAYAGTAQRQADVAMSERMYARSRPGGGD